MKINNRFFAVYFTIFFSSLLSLASCSKKNSGPSSYFISCDINGKQEVFTNGATGNLASTYLEIQAGNTVNNGSASSDNIDIILNYQPIVANKTYQDNDSNLYTRNYVSVEYDEGNDPDSYYLSSWDYYYYSPPSGYIDNMTVTISELDSNYIRGTFQGNMYYEGTSITNQLKFTNGKFYVKLF